MFGLTKKKTNINFEINMDSRLQECLKAAVATDGEYESISDLSSLLANTIGNVDVTIISLGYHDNLQFISTTIPNEDDFMSIKEDFSKLYESNNHSVAVFQNLNFSEYLTKRDDVEEIECVALRMGSNIVGFVLIEKYEEIDTSNMPLKSLYALITLVVQNFMLQQQNKVALYMDSQTLLLGRDSMNARIKEIDKVESRLSNGCIGILYIKNILELHELANEQLIFREIAELIMNVLNINDVYRIADTEIAFFVQKDHVDTSSMLHSLKDSLSSKFLSLKFNIAFADICGNAKKALHLCEAQVYLLEDGRVHFFNENVEQINVLDDLNKVIQSEEKPEEKIDNADEVPISTDIGKKTFIQVPFSKTAKMGKKRGKKSKNSVLGKHDDVEFLLNFEDFI